MRYWRILILFVSACVLFLPNVSAQRKFAPGVLQTITPKIDTRDAHSLPMTLPGVQAVSYDPNFLPKSATLHGQTRRIVMFRDVWQYELTFLPVRQLDIVSRTGDGGVVTRNVWYMVYRVRNTGAAVSHTEIEDPKFGHKDEEIDLYPTQLDANTLHGRFFGRFSLEGHVQNKNTGMYTEVKYSDQVSPSVVALIQNEEDPDRPLMDSVEIAKQVLQPVDPSTQAGGVWGVAIWYDVDPRIDYVNVKISGLTNAYRLVANQDGTHDFLYKTLQLNFWRPGDDLDEADDVVDYGIPLVDDSHEQITIAEMYDLPGPIIRCDYLNNDTQRRILVFEADAKLRPGNLDSEVAISLDGGEIPESIQRGFTDAGIELSAAATLEPLVDGSQWTITDRVDGEVSIYILNLAPQFWEKHGDGKIRFIRSLDHLWIYR